MAKRKSDSHGRRPGALESDGIARSVWGRPYSQDELDDAQAHFGLVFPPDLVAFYREHRLAEGWDWTHQRNEIESQLRWPFEGFLFDIKHGEWWPEWGPRPASLEEQTEVLRTVLAKAPKLIPLYSHRYLPETPRQAGNPVFSVYQSDIIYYGSNLADYVRREFNGWGDGPWPAIRRIPFWSDFAEA